MLMKKWYIPLLFFRSSRQEVISVEPFLPDLENTHLRGSVNDALDSDFPLIVLQDSWLPFRSQF